MKQLTSVENAIFARLLKDIGRPVLATDLLAVTGLQCTVKSLQEFHIHYLKIKVKPEYRIFNERGKGYGIRLAGLKRCCPHCGKEI